MHTGMPVILVGDIREAEREREREFIVHTVMAVILVGDIREAERESLECILL